MSHDDFVEGFCLQHTDFYVCECLFDDMVKIKFSEDVMMKLLFCLHINLGICTRYL